MVQAVVSLPGALPDQVLADETAVYVSLENGAVTAIAPALAAQDPQELSRTPTIDWMMPLAGSLVDFGGMTYGEGLVFRLIDAGAGQQIEATFASTGQPSWTLPFDWSTAQIVADTGPTQYSPNGIRSGSGNIFAVDAENRLFGLAGNTGTVNWQIGFEQPVVSMLLDSGTLYVWDESGTMTALNPVDGSILWATSSGSTGGSQSNEHRHAGSRRHQHHRRHGRRARHAARLRPNVRRAALVDRWLRRDQYAAGPSGTCRC